MKAPKMTWIMVACCVGILAAVFLLPRAGVSLGGPLAFLLVLLCPLSHLIMMAFMGHGAHGHGDHEDCAKEREEAPGAAPASPSPGSAPATQPRALPAGGGTPPAP